MNQRNSINGVASTGNDGGALAVNADDRQPTPFKAPFRAGLMSINTGAVALADLIANPHLHLSRIVALDAHHLSLPGNVDLIHVPVEEESNTSVANRVGRSLTPAHTKEVIAAISGLDVIFVLVRLGEPGESSVAIAISNALMEARIPTFGIALLPIGHAKRSDAKHASEELQTLGRYLTTFPISQEDLVRRRLGGTELDELDIDTNLTPQIIEQIQSVSREDVPTAIERIVSAVLAPELCDTRVTYDFADLVASLDCSALASIGYGSSSAAEGLECAINHALDHPLLGRDSVEAASGILVVIESRMSGEKMGIVRNAMNLVRDLMGDQCKVLFSWIADKDLPSDYRATLMAAHFDSKIAESRRRASDGIMARVTCAPTSVDVSEADLNAATTLIQSAFQPGMAIRGPVPLLQRHLRIGHQKALAIVQALEYAGVIEPTAGEAASFSHRRVS